MKVISISLAVCIVVACLGTSANAQCYFLGNTLAVKGTKNLVVRLKNPPKTKVTLSIDKKGGFHHELVWDPVIGDGLKHDVILEASVNDDETVDASRPEDNEDDYELRAYAEEDRLQTQQMIVVITRQFRPKRQSLSNKTWLRTGTLTSSLQTTVLSVSGPKPLENPKKPEGLEKQDPDGPLLALECDVDGVEMSKQYLDPKRIYAASVTRGFLDQAAPTVVTDTLALLAEIAVERAKSGALELVRDRFVKPMCDKLTLQLLKLGNKDGSGDANERVFPRTCAMLESMRLQDLLSAGRNLVEAARDDIRLTLVPTILLKAEIPGHARDLASVALHLGNQMLDGGGNELAEIDLLLTQLDRVFQHGLPANLDTVKRAFINASEALLEQQKDALITEYLVRVVPEDPGRISSQYVVPTVDEKKLDEVLGISKSTACRRLKDTESVFIAADRRKCLDALKLIVAAKPNWLDLAKDVLPTDVLIRIIESAQNGANNTFKDWLGTAPAINVVQISESLLQSCAARVTIAIVKWCSGRDSCTAGRIATALDDPRSLFKPPTGNDLGDNLCWTQDRVPAKRVLRLPTDRSKYIELATRALAFLTPAEKGQERARVQAILHWMFDLAKSVDANAVKSLEKLEEVIALFEKRDYVRAIAQAMTMAAGIAKCDEKCERSLGRTMQLIGAVTSYLQVYDETKSVDAAEARAARKKAIESLIDSATDRKDRGRQWIVSIGSNVGVATGWTDRVNLQDDHKRVHGFRVPLGLAYQFLPQGSDGVWGGCMKEFVNLWGVQLGVQVADLGQFINRNDDNDVTWSSFIAPGIEAGLLFGRPNRLLSITAHATYVPSLTENSHPVWRLGVALSYYVPFFDLN